jgi:hypothetical protein
MKRFALATLLLVLPACSTEFEATFNLDLVDFGTFEWADGPLTETEDVFVVNNGSSGFWLHNLELVGDDAEAFTVVPARSDFELPFEIGAGVGTELILRFVGVADDAQEEFNTILEARIGPASRGARVRASLEVPVTISLTCDADGDGDPHPSCGGTDCDDHDPELAGTLPELCNGRDDDCVGGPDADPDGEVDLDNDGFRTCEDCDDSNPLINPDATEACDGVDNDCNGVADHPDGEQDEDGDGILACHDCDDTDPDIDEFDCL